MKKSILLFLITWISIFFVYAQDQPKKETRFSPGLSFSTFGKYGVISLGFHNEDYPEFSSNSFYSSGISFFFKTNKMVEIETGVYYNFHSINIDHTYPTPPIKVRTKEKIELIEIPVNIRFDFPYFYVSTGLLIDFEMNNSNIVDEQTGIGFNTGLGVSYKFKSGILVYTGPIVYIHTIFPLAQDKLMSGMSFKFGVAF
jgi:hypothetical protein